MKIIFTFGDLVSLVVVIASLVAALGFVVMLEVDNRKRRKLKERGTDKNGKR